MTGSPDIDLTDGDFFADGGARAAYRWMRANEPVFRDRNGLAAASTYQAVLDAERNPEIFSNTGGIRPDQPAMPYMIDMDDPGHLLRRKLVNAGFTRKQVMDKAAGIDTLCDTLIDAVCERGECDFVRDLAAPLPMAVIGDMLGVLPADRATLLKWSDDLVCGLSASADAAALQAVMEAFAGYQGFAMQTTHKRRAEPTGDLFSILVNSEVDGQRLSDDEIVFETLLILIGGDETTRHTLTGGVEQLLRNPDQWQRVLEDAALVRSAVEEMLRRTLAAGEASFLTVLKLFGDVPSPALLLRGRRQVLILDEEVPRPERDSGSLRQVNLIRLLLQGGAHVVFVPTRREHGGVATEALQRMGVEVWYAPFLDGVAGWLRSHGTRFNVVMMVRHHVANECLPLLERYAPQARTVFDTVDLHYLRERRGAEVAGDAGLLRNAERTRASELAVMDRCDITVLVSAAEREQLQADAPQVRVELISNLHEVAGTGAPFAQRHDLVFVGGFRHPPNLDAMEWFIGDVFPHIRAALPQVRLHCIGAGAPDTLLDLAATQPGVVMHGFVEDIVPYMDGARIAIAPLRFGAGVKGKINLSMAHGQPVVGTTCAVEGMHLRAGQDVLVADDATGFADAVVRLYQDPVLWQQLAAAGLANVAEHFSLDAASATVQRVFFDQSM